VLKKYPNLILLNSYWLYEDGKHAWYEVIMADPTHQVMRVDTNVIKTK
jgi:large subunit ribosomal protein L15e